MISNNNNNNNNSTQKNGRSSASRRHWVNQGMARRASKLASVAVSQRDSTTELDESQRTHEDDDFDSLSQHCMAEVVVVEAPASPTKIIE
mmetsp:Transcript_29558/g.68971  ORF Transcript_29558/g.68971 Transcript_29558/m.68971 type:complete len:90 (-) Transcript_29558:229-498(-)